MAYPVAPVTMPANLAGQQNGKLPSSLLVTPGFPGWPSGRCHPQAARSWNALTAEVARLFRVTMTITSTHDAYRSYAIQESTFRLRYTRTPLAGRPTKQWDSDGNGVKETWWQKPNTAMSAVPGTSNHGWGLAFDACYWVNGTTLGITAYANVFNWLLRNAVLYGFSWEVQSEPWHIRLFTGDKTPKAVIDFEKPIPPVPGPTPGPNPQKPMSAKESGMWFISNYAGDYWYLVAPDHSVKYRLTQEHAWLLLDPAGGQSHPRSDVPAAKLEKITELTTPWSAQWGEM
jgi:hypothetical protein